MVVAVASAGLTMLAWCLAMLAGSVSEHLVGLAALVAKVVLSLAGVHFAPDLQVHLAAALPVAVALPLHVVLFLLPVFL